MAPATSLHESGTILLSRRATQGISLSLRAVIKPSPVADLRAIAKRAITLAYVPATADLIGEMPTEKKSKVRPPPFVAPYKATIASRLKLEWHRIITLIAYKALLPPATK